MPHLIQDRRYKMTAENFCPVCETNGLVAKSYSKLVVYKDHKKTLSNLLRSECQNCGSVVVNADQSRHNKRAILAFHKESDGLLTGNQVKVIRKKLGLTQSQAAQLFGGGPVAFSKYENDEITQSESMDKLLRLTAASQEALVFLAKASNIPIEYEPTHGIKAQKVTNILDYITRLDAMLIPEAHKFVRLNSSNINLQMNDTNYYDTQFAAG